METMETMERNGAERSEQRRRRQDFTEEFKAEIVERCRTGDRSIRQVARDFGLTESAVRRWLSQSEVDADERAGLSTEECKELSELRRENRRLREDNDILRRATAFFAREIR